MADLTFPIGRAAPQQLGSFGPSYLQFGPKVLSGVGGIAGLAGQLIVAPTPTASPQLDEIHYWDNPSYRAPAMIEDLDMYPGGFDVIMPGQETWVSSPVINVQGDWLGEREGAIYAPDAPVVMPEGMGLRTRYARPRDRLAGKTIDLDWSRVTPGADLIDALPASVNPARGIRQAQQVDLLRGIRVSMEGSRARLKVFTKSVDPLYWSRRRNKDQKAGRRSYRSFLRAFDRTVGTATEVQDFIEALIMNTWYELPSGNIVNLSTTAYSLSRWWQLILSGHAKVDFPGLLLDVTFQQAGDFATALPGLPMEYMAGRSPVWTPDMFSANETFSRKGRKEMEDVLTPQVLRELSRIKRQIDPQRRARVQELFARTSSL